MVQIDSDPYIKHSLHTSMFFPSTRLFVAGNPKAAGTTLRWWLLAAHGVDVRARTAESWWGESAPFQTVWDQRVDLKFTWGDLSAEQRDDAITSTDVLTVQPVRHPLSRLFSAWSGKYLIGEPYYVKRLPEAFPKMPETIDDEQHIADLFEEFVAALHDVVAERGFLAVDVHLWPQYRLLARPPAGDRVVLRQEEMGEGISTIREYLKQRGLEVGEAPRINETVVPYRTELVTDQTFDRVGSLYTEDFERWQYQRARPKSSSRAIDLDWLNDVRGRNARYGVVHQALVQQRDENARLRDEIANLRNREHELRDSTSWKVTGPLRWVSKKARR
jgi:hypothetical protein